MIYDVVYPDPPRQPSAHEITLDLVLSQGLEAPRRAGLVTVMQRDDSAQRAAFAVGISVSEITSGHQIVQLAEYLHECNLHPCSFRHAWDRIPFTMEPLHDTQDGDSFIVAVNSHPTAANNPALPSSSAQAALQCDHDMEIDVDQVMPSDDPDSSVPSPSVDQNPPRMHGIYIHRLGHPQVFGHVRWDSPEHVLIDAAARVALPYHEFVAFHHLQASPDDLNDHQDSIILQHVQDIQFGSTEKLILVDLELHTHGSTNTVPRAPPVSRMVYKVAPTLVRQHLLHLTRTAAYCNWHPRDCLVSCNREIWPAQDLGPRRIAHGMYVRIVIPPPPHPEWDISHAIQTFHESSEFFDEPESFRVAESLLQQGPSGTVPQNDPGAARPHTCKPADLNVDIDVPVTSSEPNTRLRRLRPVHDGTDHWLMDLGHLFTTHAEEEVVDEVFMYVQTWFIDHQRYTVCKRPRPVRLDSHSVTWIDDFRHEWRDLLDPTTPFSIHVVKPRPPQYRHYNYACHVILEQHGTPGRVAGILTALLSGYTQDGIIQGAFSTARFLRLPDLIEYLEVEPFCTGRRCTAYYDLEPVHLVAATEVTTGFSIRLHIDRLNMQLPVTPTVAARGYFDDISFLQVPSELPVATKPVDAIDVPQTAPECSSFRFNPLSEPFQPIFGVVDETPEFVQELHALWQQKCLCMGRRRTFHFCCYVVC